MSIPPSEYSYGGSELQLFADARNWKQYLRRQMAPYLRGKVLEVGAGLGATAQALAGGRERAWICLEPDPRLASRIQERIAGGALPPHCTVVVGTTADVDEQAGCDAVIYVDVLEHIENDHAELSRAARIVVAGGHVVVLAPAHQWLYSPFDKAIGHYRRYSRKTLEAMCIPGLQLRQSRYLDSAGLIASAGNRLVLRSAMPTRRQIDVWDRLLVPISRALDPLLLHRLGKSVLVVWQRI